MTNRSLFDLYHTQNWIFDLDNTLYAAETDLFAQIDARMTEFVGNYLNIDAKTAKTQQKHYYSTYGTTLNGMMREHNMPARAFLDYVHDLDYSPLSKAPELRQVIETLPGRKFVFTNGSRGHAERTLLALGLDGVFEDLFDIEATNYQPKPSRASFDALINTHGLDPKASTMVEDLSRNLVTAHELGMATILVWSRKDWSHEPDGARPAVASDEIPAYVDFATGDLTGFLQSVVSEGVRG